MTKENSEDQRIKLRTPIAAKLGYREVDRHALIEDGREFTELLWQLERERWLASSIRREIAPTVSGADGMVTLLGGPGTV